MSGEFPFQKLVVDPDVTEQKRLFLFFYTLKKAKIAKGFMSAFNGSLLRRVGERSDLNSNNACWSNPTGNLNRNLSFTTFKNFRANKYETRSIIEELPKVEIHPEHFEFVKAAYEHFLERDFEPTPGEDFAIFRRHDAIERTGENGQIRLDGDYLMYRVEQRLRERNAGSGPVKESVSQVSINFLRFFPHRLEGTRFMMLSLAAYRHMGNNRYLGARGWVDNLGDQILATGRIVSRKGPRIDHEVDFGGMSTLVVEVNKTAPFVIYREHDGGQRHTVETAACLHMRALYGQQPSLARGYLVRCNGLESYGGHKDQLVGERYREIRALHKQLGEQHPADITMEDAAEALARATGYAQDVFFHSDKDTGMPRGLLVNLPFARDGEQRPVNMPLMLPSEDAPSWAADHPARRLLPDAQFGITVQLSDRDDSDDNPVA
ncbi:hypothetical protein [Antarctobacter sp.]|uniref:hypothetical protein n=1 Tax=Antarctobacter sp. TaxID=1872577 RepID=UPI003A8DA943